MVSHSVCNFYATHWKKTGNSEYDFLRRVPQRQGKGERGESWIKITKVQFK